MIRIENVLHQPLVINCGAGRVVHLLPQGAVLLSEAEFASAEVQGLLAQGAIQKAPEKGKER